MKKSIIASVIALGMVSGLAQAAVNEVQFHGTVSTVTCDLAPSVDGSLNPNGNRIELGDLKIGQKGQVVKFSFKPTTQDPANVTACNDIAKDPNKTVSMTWRSDKFGAKGLGIITGDAKDSFVNIAPVNDKGAGKDIITANNTTHEFSASMLADGAEGLKYSAFLQAGQQAGDFQTAATFTMAYK